MRIFCLITILLLANPIFSATVNGNLTTGNAGTASFNSKGSVDINVTKGDAVQISNLNTIVISDDNGGNADRTASDNVCYYATTAQYTVDMNTLNNFKLVNGNKTVSYRVYWDDGKNGSVDATFRRNNNNAKTFSSNNRTSANCQTTAGTNATITVFIRGQNYRNMPTVGLYTDTVNITLKAQ